MCVAIAEVVSRRTAVGDRGCPPPPPRLPPFIKLRRCLVGDTAAGGADGAASPSSSPRPTRTCARVIPTVTPRRGPSC